MSLNKVMLIGNVGKDPEIRYLPNSENAKVASFPLATTERYKDRNGETHEQTEWHNIIVWRNRAEIVEKYVKKGTQLYIEGKIHTRSWEDQSGNTRYTTEITADSIELLGKRSENPASGSSSVPPSISSGQDQQLSASVNIDNVNYSRDLPEDDLPF